MFTHQPIDALDERLSGSTGRERAEILTRLAWGTAPRNPTAAEEFAREAIDLAMQSGDRGLAARARVIRARTCVTRQAFDDALAEIETARREVDDDDSVCGALIHNVVGEVDYQRRNLHASTAELEDGLGALAPGTEGEPEVRLMLVNNLGRVQFVLGEYPRALEYFVEALDLARSLGDTRTEGILRTNIGNVLSEVGDLEGALQAYRKSLAIHRESHDEYGISLSLGNLGEILHRIGDHREALRICDELLGMPTTRSNADLHAPMLLLRSRAHAALGNHLEAQDSAEEALELHRSSHNPAGQAEALSNLGDLAALRGAELEAFELYGKSLALEGQDRSVELGTRLGVARTRLMACQVSSAVDELERLVEDVEKTGDRRKLVEVLRTYSEAQEEAQDHEGALATFRRLRRVERALFREDSAKRLEVLRVLHQVEQARHRETTLSLARDELELRVAERTSALQATNAELAAALEQRDQAEVERARLEEELRHAQKMEAVGRLAGGMAHDFNNLLTVIRGYGELLLEQVSPDGPGTEAAVQVLSAAERAARLTSELLAFSRKRPVRPEVVDVRRTISDLEVMLRRLLGDEIEFSFTADAEVGPVEIDPSQLEQVVINLLVNAADAMPSGGSLAIELSQVRVRSGQEPAPGDYTRLRVTDTGSGMDEATERLIFDPFFTTKETGKGTGLGLSTVYGIVKQSKGDIRVTSEPGKGSCFEVLLPTTKAPRTSEAPGPTEAEPPIEGPVTVLLVEDEASVRSLIREALERWGYHVLEAEDGSRALEIARDPSVAIDLVLSDVVMPRLPGPALKASIEELRPGMRFLFTSGYPDGVGPSTEWTAEFAFIQKPFTMSELRRSVQELLRKPVGT